jgi:hypothetical protein
MTFFAAQMTFFAVWRNEILCSQPAAWTGAAYSFPFPVRTSEPVVDAMIRHCRTLLCDNGPTRDGDGRDAHGLREDSCRAAACAQGRGRRFRGPS